MKYTNTVIQVVMLLTCIQEMSASNFGQNSEVLCGFIQSFQANPRMVQELRSQLLFVSPEGLE